MRVPESGSGHPTARVRLSLTATKQHLTRNRIRHSPSPCLLRVLRWINGASASTPPIAVAMAATGIMEFASTGALPQCARALVRDCTPSTSSERCPHSDPVMASHCDDYRMSLQAA